MVLHGCQQDAAGIRSLTRFDALADEEGFIVVYPETGPAVGNPLGCWIWWDPDNQTRSRGAPQDLVAILQRVIRTANADPERVYVTGFSSGAALATNLGALYPDVIAAVGVHSGVAYAAGASAGCALSVTQSGAPDPQGRGRIAYHAQGPNHRIVPAMVLQGDDDNTVQPVNADGIVIRMVATNDLADDGETNGSFPSGEPEQRSERASAGKSFSVTGYTDTAGRRVLVKIVIAGMRHAWSGGAPDGTYADPEGPDASRLLWQFLRQWTLGEPSLHGAPVAACRDRHGSNLSHFWWHRTMSYREFACDIWGAGWRRSYGDDWGPGRCP
jgi:poly(hydroxyalkanoate) depolymerase family esterase